MVWWRKAGGWRAAGKRHSCSRVDGDVSGRGGAPPASHASKSPPRASHAIPPPPTRSGTMPSRRAAAWRPCRGRPRLPPCRQCRWQASCRAGGRRRRRGGRGVNRGWSWGKTLDGAAGQILARDGPRRSDGPNLGRSGGPNLGWSCGPNLGWSCEPNLGWSGEPFPCWHRERRHRRRANAAGRFDWPNHRLGSATCLAGARAEARRRGAAASCPGQGSTPAQL